MRAYAQVSALSEAERERLITDHIEMARRIALRLARNTSMATERDDVVSVAMMGLVESANRYEPRNGEPFGAFAQRRIRGAVLDELRRRDVLPRRVRKRVKQAGEVQRKIEHAKGGAAEDEEVAQALGVTVEAYREDLEAASNISFVDLDGEDRLYERLSSEASARTPHDNAEKLEQAVLLKTALKAIPERDAKILALYYVEEFTYSEIASLLEVSAPRVCQLHARALTRLRAELATLVEDAA